MAKTHDHEIVSIYPFTDAETDRLMTHAYECVLMWSTKDGWPVGVTHSSTSLGHTTWISTAMPPSTRRDLRKGGTSGRARNGAGLPIVTDPEAGRFRTTVQLRAAGMTERVG